MSFEESLVVSILKYRHRGEARRDTMQHWKYLAERQGRRRARRIYLAKPIDRADGVNVRQIADCDGHQKVWLCVEALSNIWLNLRNEL